MGCPARALCTSAHRMRVQAVIGATGVRVLREAVVAAGPSACLGGASAGTGDKLRALRTSQAAWTLMKALSAASPRLRSGWHAFACEGEMESL